MPTENLVALDAGSYRERVLAERDRLVADHLDLVRRIARDIARRLPPSFDLEDLVGAGNLALVHLATRYRPGQHPGVTFEVFARKRLRGAMLDTFSKPGKYAENTRPSLADAPEPIIESILDRFLDVRRLRGEIWASIAELEPKQRAVVNAYYGDDEPSMREVAAREGLSPTAVWWIHSNALDELRRRLKAA